MANNKKLSREDLDICISACFDALATDRKIGLTARNQVAYDEARVMSRLEDFLDRVTEKNYCKLIEDLIEHQGSSFGKNKRDRIRFRLQTDLNFLPTFIHFAHNLPEEYQFSEEIEVFRSL